MTVFTATTTSEVRTMVAAAKAGDSVLLAPGTYEGLDLSNIRSSSWIPITSVDPDNPALLKGLTINNSGGLKFSNLEIQTATDAPFTVTKSNVIAFDNIDVHGTLNGSSSDDGNGLIVRFSSYVTVSNSHFHELGAGIMHQNSQALTITGNAFDTINNDGVAGGGSSQVTISNNTFTNFDHTGDVHPDAIQFWTTNTTASATNLVITGNVYDRGTGSAVQGIFLNDETGKLPYRNVTIKNNVVVGAAYNGIFISGGASAAIAENTVIGTEDQPSWISLFSVTGVNLADNIATAYNFYKSSVVGHGDVLASAIALAPDGSFPDWRTGMAAPTKAEIADQAQADLLEVISLIGFTDGPSLTGHTYDFDTLSFEGTDGADRLTAGLAGAHHLYGYGGDDTLAGNKAGVANILEGGEGNDTYLVYQSIDQVVENADEGSDTVGSYVSYTLGANIENMRALAAGVTLTGNELANAMTVAAGGSTLFGLGGDDRLQGGTGWDRLYGGEGKDQLSGYDGNDVLDGGNGDDSLSGGNGNDVMLGGAGIDSMQGNAGADTMTGGTGADSYIYRPGDFAGGLAASTDIIKDFNYAEGDRISLSMIDANSRTPVNESFRFIGTAGFRGGASELRYAADGDGITVYGDINGDRVADFAIHFTGLTSITASSFML